MSKYLWAVLAGVFVVSAAGSASAQGMAYGYHQWYETPEQNIAKSEWYDHLLEVNLSFRHYRMWKECHPIVYDGPLRSDCIASFAQYEPVSPYARYDGWHHRRHWRHPHR